MALRIDSGDVAVFSCLLLIAIDRNGDRPEKRKPATRGKKRVAEGKATVQSLSSFVWSIAEILRGDFKQSEYSKVKRPRLDSRCLRPGLPMIGKLPGHTQIQTTARYAHFAADPGKLAAYEVSSAISRSLE